MQARRRFTFLAAAAHCIEDVAARYDEPLKLRRNFEEFKRDLNR